MSYDVREVARSILDNPAYQACLVADLKAGRAAKALRNMLLRYARQSVDSDGRRYARDILQQAGVEW